VHQIGIFASKNEESITAKAILDSGLTFSIIKKRKADETGFKITKEQSSLRDSAGTSYSPVGWVELRCYAGAKSYTEKFYVVKKAHYDVMLSPSSSLYHELENPKLGVRIIAHRSLTSGMSFHKNEQVTLLTVFL
jgi:hypothetical protein